MATLSNAVIAATNSFQNIETTDKKFELEKQKIESRKDGPTNIHQTIEFSGSFKDALKQLKNFDSTELIEVKAEVRKD
jgi:hypothetical protein